MGYSPEAALATRNETLGAKIAAGDTSGLRGAVGTPDQVREFLRRYEEAGVDQIIFVLQAGRNRHEHIMESLELFANEVLPEFKERDEAASAAKEKRMAPIIDKVMARKPASDHPPIPPDYSIPAIPRAEADRGESDKFHAWLDDYAERLAAGEDVSRRLA